MTSNKENPPARTCLGKIATAHGIRGLVKVLVHGDDPHLLTGAMFTGATGDHTIVLTMKNSMGKYWLAAIEGVNDRTEAEKLRGTELWLERKLLPETAENEFYYDELVGLSAVDAEGGVIGKILAVENFGAGDLLEIKPLSGESFYIPFNDEYVPEIDIKAGKVVLAHVEDVQE